MIRKVIKANLRALEKHGELIRHRPTVERPQGCGTPGFEFWLETNSS
jgi:hypothetical protein